MLTLVGSDILGEMFICILQKAYRNTEQPPSCPRARGLQLMLMQNQVCFSHKLKAELVPVTLGLPSLLIRTGHVVHLSLSFTTSASVSQKART